MSAEQKGNNIPRWERVEIAPGHYIHQTTISPEIQARMPVATRTFMQVGLFELLVHEFKKLVNPDQEIPL